jgi:apolipoprotein D and lipocalin family protein
MRGPRYPHAFPAYSPIIMIRVIATIFLAAMLVACVGNEPPVQTVQHVDLPRYMGDWYVIANIPYFAEKNCFDSIESYSLRSDNRIENWFQCRKKSFSAPMQKKGTAVDKVLDTSSNAIWTVHFFKVFPVKYLIIAVDPNYQWAAVAHPSRKYGWILARTKTLPDQTYRAVLAKFAAQGYDTSKFAHVPQRPDNTSGASGSPSAP